MSPWLQYLLHVLVVALAVFFCSKRAYRNGYKAGERAGRLSIRPLNRLLGKMKYYAAGYQEGRTEKVLKEHRTEMFANLN